MAHGVTSRAPLDVDSELDMLSDDIRESDFSELSDRWRDTEEFSESMRRNRQSDSTLRRSDASSLLRDDSIDGSLVESRTRALSVPDEEEPEDDEDFYTITWEYGQLGIIFHKNASGVPIIRRVNKKGDAKGLQYARAGDVLVSMNRKDVTRLPFEEVVSQLKSGRFPIHLVFRPLSPEDLVTEQSQAPVPTMPVVPEDEYDVIWAEGPLGCGVKQRDGMPFVKTVTGNGVSPSVAQIQVNDVLIAINGHRTADIGFKKTVKLMQTSAKPVHLRFRRHDPNDPTDPPTRTTSSSTTRDPARHGKLRLDEAEPELGPNQYSVLWKDGLLGIQIIERRTDHRVIVSKITGQGSAPLSDKLEAGDVFVRIGGKDVDTLGIEGAFEYLRKVRKPVILIFEKPARIHAGSDPVTNDHVPNFRQLRAQRKEAPATTSGNFHHARSSSDKSLNKPARPLSGGKTPPNITSNTVLEEPSPPIEEDLPPPPSYDEVVKAEEDLPPRVSEIENGRVQIKPVTELPPPPSYMDVFTMSGRERPPIEGPPPPYPDTNKEGSKIELLRKKYIEEERERNRAQNVAMQKANSVLMSIQSNANSEFSDYDSIDASGQLVPKLHNQARVTKQLPPPEVYVNWAEGPLGITFKRKKDKRIVVSRLTGHGYSQGLDRLQDGDWLVSFGGISTEGLGLKETMRMLKELPKPVHMCFRLQPKDGANGN